MKKKIEALQEEIEELQRYVAFGRKIAKRAADRWRIHDVYHSDQRHLNVSALMSRLQELRLMFEMVDGEAKGKGFDTPADIEEGVDRG